MKTTKCSNYTNNLITEEHELGECKNVSKYLPVNVYH